VAQTTRKPEDFLEIVNALILQHKEVRVFNTICNATFENQDAAKDSGKESRYYGCPLGRLPLLKY